MGYNKGLEGRTTHDWLNRDAAEVDKYLADERCTFTFTLNAYYSMFSGILRLHDPAFLARMPKDLPLLFLAGTADPVGDRGKGVLRAIHTAPHLLCIFQSRCPAHRATRNSNAYQDHFSSVTTAHYSRIFVI